MASGSARRCIRSGCAHNEPIHADGEDICRFRETTVLEPRIDGEVGVVDLDCHLSFSGISLGTKLTSTASNAPAPFENCPVRRDRALLGRRKVSSSADPSCAQPRPVMQLEPHHHHELELSSGTAMVVVVGAASVDVLHAAIHSSDRRVHDIECDSIGTLVGIRRLKI